MERIITKELEDRIIKAIKQGKTIEIRREQNKAVFIEQERKLIEKKEY